MSHLYIFAMILFVVYGQLILKWQVTMGGPFPSGVINKLWFLLHLLVNPWIISGLVGGFLASICWMAAMTKFELSYAYPFTSLSFILVLILSGLFFHEPITIYKIIGSVLIVSGIIVGVQG